MAGGHRCTKAIVRGVPDAFDSCIKPRGIDASIDVELAREQHAAYCAALVGLGLELIRLDADERYPDCCFVEDTAVVTPGAAVVCHMGAASRRGEEAAVVEALGGRPIHRMERPAAMDGGDVIREGNKVFVGLTDRTNADAVRWLEAVLALEGLEVISVPVNGYLHLKSACTPVAPNVMLVAEGFASARESFAGYERLVVTRAESYAANCLSVNGTVLVSEGYPHARELVRSLGVPTETLSMTEFRKAGGSLTCLSILL